MTELNLAGMAGIEISTHRFDRSVLVDVAWPEGRETFFLVEGDHTLGLMAFDPGDPTYPEPRMYLVPKPHATDLGASDEDLLLLIWQVFGGGR
jgi:hypothetical protein